MATEPGKAGKFLLWRHDRLPLPPALLTNLDLVGRIRNANEDADLIADEMRRRFALVARTFIAGERDGGLKPDPDDVKALVSKFDPRRGVLGES
jgi:CRISPR system Cascade subunit CasA